MKLETLVNIRSFASEKEAVCAVQPAWAVSLLWRDGERASSRACVALGPVHVLNRCFSTVYLVSSVGFSMRQAEDNEKPVWLPVSR